MQPVALLRPRAVFTSCFSHLIETQEAFILCVFSSATLALSSPLHPFIILILHPPVPVLCLLFCAPLVRLIYLSRTPLPDTFSGHSSPSPSPLNCISCSAPLTVKTKLLNIHLEHLSQLEYDWTNQRPLERKEAELQSGFIFRCHVSQRERQCRTGYFCCLTARRLWV